MLYNEPSPLETRVLTRRFGLPNSAHIDTYLANGGYKSFEKSLEMTQEQIIDEVKASNLRGRGGAGFPTGVKWSLVPQGPDARHPKYLVVNGDEMEPGTFKDRLLLEGDPHGLIEGVIVTAYALQADIAYVFLRGEYVVAERLVRKAIEEARAAGYIGENILGSGWSLQVHVHMSGGRYICGEETALLNALEGKRANPRAKPPFPQISGLFGKPTIVNNVETMYNIPHIVNNGPAWFKGLSKTANGGTKLYGVSGKVVRPGVWELPMGTTFNEIIYEHAGGMKPGLTLRGIIPGGASTDFLLPEHLDTPSDFDTVGKLGSRMGTGTMIVLDDQTCPIGMVLNITQFMAQESCGWCTPCRDGLPWAAKTLQAIENGEGQEGDIERLQKQVRLLGPGLTFCALAPGAIAPIGSGIKHFRAEFEAHIREKRCAWRS